MNITNLSAGTGPAALGLGGVVLFLAGHEALGILLILSSVCLSFVWTLRFK